MQSLRIHPEVHEALNNGRPVVALETAVATHGLPRTATPLPDDLQIDGWHSDEPINIEIVRAMSRCMRAENAVPAVIAIIQGALHIGLDDHQLVELAQHSRAAKAASHNLAMLLATGQTAGTTVSATLAACRLANSIYPRKSPSNPHSARPAISVFATGGIGGVHRDWQQTPDISADLRALATTSVCVVSSGAKSILDLPATVEALETLGVPVIGYQTDGFPQFQCEPSASIRLSQRADDVQTVARACELHWNVLGFSSGLLLANPVPPRFELKSTEYERIVGEAEAAARSQGIAGASRTPFLLGEIARRTANRSLHANLALLISNARLAAQLAVALAAR